MVHVQVLITAIAKCMYACPSYPWSRYTCSPREANHLNPCCNGVIQYQNIITHAWNAIIRVKYNPCTVICAHTCSYNYRLRGLDDLFEPWPALSKTNGNVDDRGNVIFQQEAQGLGALLDKMEDNDHINWITQKPRCIVHSKNCRFRDTRFWKSEIHRMTPEWP